MDVTIDQTTGLPQDSVIGQRNPHGWFVKNERLGVTTFEGELQKCIELHVGVLKAGEYDKEKIEALGPSFKVGLQVGFLVGRLRKRMMRNLSSWYCDFCEAYPPGNTVCRHQQVALDAFDESVKDENI